ncbi:GPW/gp25 family protein [Escherichia coli]
MSIDYIGMNPHGPGTISGHDHLKSAIRDIILTPIGTRIMRRDYGSLLPALIDSPMNDVTRLQCMSAAVIAISRWEPRVAVSAVDVVWNKQGRALLSLNCLIVNTMEKLEFSVDMGGKADAGH